MPSDIPPKQKFENTPGDHDFYESSPGKRTLADNPGEPSQNAPGALVSIHAAALKSNADSFPVLKAFQDYLESERQRARKRMILLSVVFVITLLVVVGGLLTGGIFVYLRAVRHNEEMQRNLVELALQKQPAAAAASSIDPARLAEEFAARFQNLPVQNRSPQNEEDSVSLEVEKIRTGLDALQSENTRLREQIGALSNSLPELASMLTEKILTRRNERAEREAVPVVPRANAKRPTPKIPDTSEDVAETVGEISPQPEQEVRESDRSFKAPRTSGSASELPEGYREATLLIPPSGEGQPMPWRVLIPE